MTDSAIRYVTAVCLLRGVNVGGHRRVKMEALRNLCESLGFRDPKTYVQSGNVVLKTAEHELAQVGVRLEAAIAQAFGFQVSVIVRSPAELREAAANNPFALRPDMDPRRLLITFLASDPGQEIRDRVLSINAHPEELRMRNREVYVYYPDGMARPKLSMATVERMLKTPATGRNWNTVLKLLEMGELYDASE